MDRAAPVRRVGKLRRGGEAYGGLKGGNGFRSKSKCADGFRSMGLGRAGLAALRKVGNRWSGPLWGGRWGNSGEAYGGV